MAYGVVYHPLLGDRIYPAVRQRRSHHCQVLGAHVQCTLFSIEIDRLSWVDIDPSVALQQTGYALISIVGFGRGDVNFVVVRQCSPGEPRQPFVNELPFEFEGGTRHQAGCGDCSRIYHRVGPAVWVPLDAGERVERQPGCIHANFRRASSTPSSWQTNANTNGLETLMIVN